MTEQTPPPETTGRQQGGRFAPGFSGNPSGRPRGSRHATTLAIEALLEGQAEGLTQKAIDMALSGDTTALRLCLERIAPAMKDRTITFDLPALSTPKDAPAALLALLEAVAKGEVSPSEAEALAKLVEGYRRAVETAELEQRIAALEASAERRR